MKKNMSRFKAALVVIVLAAIGSFLIGCSTTVPQPTGAGATKEPDGAAGPKLWAQNCGHCHNIRSPSSYSDAQWEVVALHMRVRANLTAEEHQKILAFLKSAH